ncbi:hypothetical protein MUY14_06275 [Amycolatopsis sp. FBCC-B4732]|nr:hypothetical protein [Amycolatopsis sp. FBCC-B4732]UOX90230.1 hypothetical protein MUY14_06275 [Amycolatopsis sp. FBCC-B4732]
MCAPTGSAPSPAPAVSSSRRPAQGSTEASGARSSSHGSGNAREVRGHHRLASRERVARRDRRQARLPHQHRAGDQVRCLEREPGRHHVHLALAQPGQDLGGPHLAKLGPAARLPLPEALGHTARSCPPAASRNATRSVPVTPRPASIARSSAVPTSPEVADEATAVSSTRRLVR